MSFKILQVNDTTPILLIIERKTHSIKARKLQDRKYSDVWTQPSLGSLNPLNLPHIEPMATIPTTATDYSTVEESDRQSLESLAKTRLPTPGKRSLQRFLAERKAKLPYFTLVQPSINRDFTGRDDYIKGLDEFLLPTGQGTDQESLGPRIFALCGMGGIGKTDLAVQYAHLKRDRFDAIFWLEAGGVSQLASNFGQIPTELGLETAEEAQDLETSIEIAKEWLATTRLANEQSLEAPPKRPWLLIFDNADSLDIILDYVPLSGSGSVLLTSRDPAAKTDTFENSLGLDMEPLKTAEAASLLSRLTRRHGDAMNQNERDASIKLAERFDGLPLAITQITRFIRKNQLSIQEFLDFYNTDVHYTQFHDEATPSQQHRYGYTLATTWSFQRLSSDARRLLGIISFLNPDRIQEDIFMNPKEKTNSAWPWKSTSFVHTRSELLSCSMIKRDIFSKEISIHRIIQTQFRKNMTEDVRYHTFLEAVHLLDKRWVPGDLCSQASQR